MVEIPADEIRDFADLLLQSMTNQSAAAVERLFALHRRGYDAETGLLSEDYATVLQAIAKAAVAALP